MSRALAVAMAPVVAPEALTGAEKAALTPLKATAVKAAGLCSMLSAM